MRISIIIGLLALLLSPAQAGCDRDAWAFYGAVRDGGGRPIADARINLLLDRPASGTDARKGDRWSSFYSNEFGKYQAGLVCSDSSDRANPCAKKPKLLAIETRAEGYADSLRVLKLKNLEIVVDGGICFVALPELKLQRSGYR